MYVNSGQVLAMSFIVNVRQTRTTDIQTAITDLANIANFKTAIKSDLLISRAFQL